MLSKKFGKAGFVAILTLSLAYCTKPLIPISNSPVTNTQAEADQASDLKKQKEIEIKADQIRHALEPITDFLNDIDGIIDIKVDGKKVSPSKALMMSLRSVLGQIATGKIETHPDGSWTLDRQTSCLNPSGTVEEGEGVIRLEGKRTDEGDQMTASVTMCDTGALEEFFNILLKKDKSIVLTFTDLRDTHPSDIKLKDAHCTLHSDELSTDLHCEPFDIDNYAMRVNVAHLEYHQAGSQVLAEIDVYAYDWDTGAEKAHASLTSNADLGTIASYCNSSGHCGVISLKK